MANKTEVSRNLQPNQENFGHYMFRSSIPTIVEPLYDSSPTTKYKNRMEYSLFLAYHKVPHLHTFTFSIAFDMQVEVLESGHLY